VFRRPGSRNLQCRFKLPTGQWHAASTGSDIFDQARQQAIGIVASIGLGFFTGGDFNISQTPPEEAHG
jgi:hypothetical protein